MIADSSTVLDLSSCESEPITFLDRVQSFGFLLAMSNDWTVLRASDNLEAHLHVPALSAIGQPLDDLVDPAALHEVRNRIFFLYSTGSERLYGIELIKGRPPFDLHIHSSGDLLLLEGEPSSRKDGMEAGSVVRTMIARLARTTSIEDFHRQAARQIRAMIAFDRVMIYRFNDNDAGEVIAEATNGRTDSFIGHHFPASDIPVQARALYLRNPFRVIADVDAMTARLLPETTAPLDLSLAITRAVSPVHIEYLKNMGVAASLSISIIVEGRLWGLIACHHSQPILPGFVTRTIAELFGRMVSLTLESRLRQGGADESRKSDQLADDMIAAIVGNESLLDDAQWLMTMMRNLVGCNGVAICRGGAIHCSGATPEIADIVPIYEYLEQRLLTRIFDTDQLSLIRPEAIKHARRAAGMMAIPISRKRRDYILLFRHERIQDIKWAGDPNKRMVPSDDGLRLSPRKSFATFTQSVSGRSQPFSDSERRVAENVRHALIEVILRYSETAEEFRKRASERQELLIAELNHRVRNILALIRGLIKTTGEEAWDLVSYVRALGGRVQALSRAHDQVTQQNWGPVAIATLIENECGAYLKGTETQLVIDGPVVYLAPNAVSTISLVIHELITNSAKYGALSQGGMVRVILERRPDQGLSLAWRESGGPEVLPPTRRGFGSVIIERTIPFDFQGTAVVRYPPTGFEADFFIPENQLSSGMQEIAGKVLVPQAITMQTLHSTDELDKPLSGFHVLLLEDNLIIALEAEDILHDCGARHVTTVSTIRDAGLALSTTTFDFAMLDVQVGSETSLEVAAGLGRANIPYILASGYGMKDLGLRPGSVAIVQKPYLREHVANAVLQMLNISKAARAPPPDVESSGL